MPSSVVARFTYYSERSVLRVVYISGAVYDYLDVPKKVYEEMKQSKSKGTYLNTKIKTNYEYRQVEP